MSAAATLLLLGFLLPTTAVFVVAYRRALSTWLARRAEPALPLATVVGHPAAPRVPLADRVHATIIAAAFAAVFTMGLIAVALVATVIATAIAAA